MTDGILLIDKPEGITSFDVVARVRRLFGTKQVGHTGTLDPLATGLLVVLVGRAVKASELLIEKDKEYIAGLRLGITTDTEDITGSVLTRSESLPAREEVAAAAGQFIGELLQTPPMYSALKVGGKKLVDLARQGITVERAPRPVTIHSLEILGGEGPDYQIRVSCSKGTYVRTLLADIGKALGCGGTMYALRRTRAGSCSVQDAHTLAEIEAMPADARQTLLSPTESLFEEYPRVMLPAFFERLARCGCEIYQKKIGTAYPEGTRLRMYGEAGFFALGEVRVYPDGTAVKSLKRFF